MVGRRFGNVTTDDHGYYVEQFLGNNLNVKKENSMYNYGPTRRQDMIYVEQTRGGAGSVSGNTIGGYKMNQSMVSG